MSLKNKIVTTAMDLFFENGFRNTSVNEVVKALGVSKGAFFHHFPDKNSLGIAVLDAYYTTSLTEWLQSIFKKKKDEKEQILLMIQTTYSEVKKFKFHGGCLLGNFALELSDIDENFRQKLQLGFEIWEKELVKKLEVLHKRKRLHTTPENFARFLIAGLEGVTMSSKVHKTPQKSKEEFQFLEEVVHRYIDDVCSSSKK